MMQQRFFPLIFPARLTTTEDLRVAEQYLAEFPKARYILVHKSDGDHIELWDRNANDIYNLTPKLLPNLIRARDLEDLHNALQKMEQQLSTLSLTPTISEVER